VATTTTLRVKGVRELVRAADAAGKETKKLVRDRLRKVAEPVLADWRRELSRYDARSASRLGISVRRTGSVSVEQRLRRTTGLHPDFGALQMTQAVAALDENAMRIEHEFEQAVDEIADNFGKR
jgi:hypothetical protein